MASHYYSSKGVLLAKFVRLLKKGECPCYYDELPEYFIQGNKVYIKMAYLTIPTLAEVETADRKTICKWWRFLPSGETEEEQKVIQRVCERFHDLGGFTTEISKEVGLGDRV